MNTHHVDRVQRWQDLPLGYGTATWMSVAKHADLSSCRPIWNINLARSASQAIERTSAALAIGARYPIKLEVLDKGLANPLNDEVVAAAEFLKSRHPGLVIWPLIAPSLPHLEALDRLGCEVIRVTGAPISSTGGVEERTRELIECVLSRDERPALMLDGGVGEVAHVVEALELGFDFILVNTFLFQPGGDPVTRLRRLCRVIYGTAERCSTPAGA